MQTRGPIFRKSGGPTGWNNDEPPVLENYSADPKYDLQTIVTLVGVRPMILWSWEQQLGVTAVPRSEDEPGAAARRYSERDLVAFLWLREQIVGGKAPADAAATLHAGQPRQAAFSSFEPRRSVATRPLSAEAWAEAGLPRNSVPDLRPSVPNPRPQAGDLAAGQTSAPSLGGATYMPSQPVPGTYGGATSGPVGRADRSGAFSRPLGGSLSGPLHGSFSGPLNAPRQPAMSGPLRAGVPSGTLAPRFSRPDLAQGQGLGTGPGGPVAAPELRTLLPQLIRAFASFDTQAANYVIDSALGSRSVETVCLNLLQPALARVGELYSRRELSMPEERFAVQYARAFLFSQFHRTPERPDAPMAIVACAPREMSEIPALMLAVFWRRSDTRVVYLGPDMDGDELLTKAREVRPAVVSMVVTMPQRVRTLARVSRRFAHVEGKRPIFGYCGPVFTRHPELRQKVEGVFLGDDAWQATWHLRRLLGTSHGVPLSPVAPVAGRFSNPSLGG